MALLGVRARLVSQLAAHTIRTPEQGGQPSNCPLYPVHSSWQEEETTAGETQSSGKGKTQNRKKLERQSATPLEF